MPDNWTGVLILLAVTAITLFADYARRWMPPPRDTEHYVPPSGPVEVPGVGPVTPAGQATAPAPDDDVEWDEGGGQEDEGA